MNIDDDNYRAVRCYVERGMDAAEIRRLTGLPLPECRRLVDRARRDLAKAQRRKQAPHG